MKNESIKMILETVSRSFDVKDAVANVLGDLSRVLAEKPYDDLANLPFFQRMREKPLPMRYLFGFLLLFGNAFLEQKLPSRTFLQKVFKEGFTDAAPEVFLRLVKKGINFPKEIQELIQKLLDMMDWQTLEKYLQMLADLPPEKRERFRENMEAFTNEVFQTEPSTPPVSAPEKAEVTPKKPGFAAGFMGVVKKRMQEPTK